MKAFVIAFCGALLAAAPALAEPAGTASASSSSAGTGSQTGTPDSANHRADAAHRPDQICRRIDSDVSRRLGSRVVCHTAAEWREIQNGG
jgi:hypothetical protein